MNLRKVVAVLVAGALPVIGVAAVPAAAADSKPVLKVAGGDQIDSLNPFIAIYQGALDVLNLEYEPLTQWNAQNREQGALAKSWKASDGGKVWTYKLNSGMVWSDGKPITAADAVWTINAIKHSDALAAANGSLVANIQSVKAVDQLTVQVTTKAAQAPDPVLGLYIVPQHVWAKISNPAKYANDSNVVGSGPYILNNYQRNQSATLAANPKWHGGTPSLSGIDFISYKDTNAATAAVRSGEIDSVSGLTAAQYASLKKAHGVGLAKPVSEHYWSIDVNPGAIDKQNKPMGNGNPVLHDVKVRQAIQEAIDQKTLVAKVLGGAGSYGPGIIPPAYPDYYLPNSVARSFSIAAANKLLDSAGYKRGPNGIRLDKSGNPIKLRFTWDSSEVMQQEVVSYVVPWLKDIGLSVTSNPESISQLASDLAQGKYDLLFDGWGVSPDPDFMLYINTCANRPNADGSGNTTAYNWCTPAYDKYYHAQHVALDQKTRQSDVRSALKMLYDSGVVDVLFYDQDLQAYRSDRFSFPDTTTYGVYGYWAFVDAKPSASGSSSSSGTPAYVWVIVAVAVVVLVGGGLLLIARRRRVRDDVE